MPSTINSQELISFLDFTSLNETDTEESIAAFCHKVILPQAQVAALCIYPRFVKQVAATLKGTGIKVATVVNFPKGDSPLGKVLQQIETCLEEGANEIDLVFPYQDFLHGQREVALDFVTRCKEGCLQATLKVILETGVFPNTDLIIQAATEVIHAGADFVKTSTGKGPKGASLEAASAILLAIKKASPTITRPLGFKASGGIREPRQAQEYLDLAKSLLGPNWPSPRTFRLGASQLLDRLLNPEPQSL